MLNRNSVRIFILLMAIASVWSCKSRKVVMDGKPIRNLNTSRIIDSVMKYQFSPGYFSSKISVDAELPNDNSQSMKLNLRMRLDSLVWGQASVMALSAAQMLVTQDSVHMLLFMTDNKGYYPRSIDYLSELLNTDLELRSLQDIFLGNPLRFDPEEKYKSPADTGFYYLSSHRKRKIEELLNMIALRVKIQSFINIVFILARLKPIR